MKNICCIYADNPGGYCKNIKVKRSLFGFGARCCVKYFNDNAKCSYYEQIPRPDINNIEITEEPKLRCDEYIVGDNWGM